jgi:UDP-N-acetylglucosamine 2-epimerase (non-hydrolysing)
MRDVTERQEGIDAGTAKLVGTDKNKIVNETKTLLENSDVYNDMARKNNPYGDGTTAKQIVEILLKEL